MEESFAKNLVKVYFWGVIKSHYADFSGRASRSQFWYYQLAGCILTLVLGIPLSIFITTSNFISAEAFAETLTSSSSIFIFLVASIILLFLVELFLFIPSLAIMVRRLHDTNRSGWFILISLIPIVGSIILLIALVSPSVEQNRFDVIKK
jgi:uncharacterized membrane protein YhaH (DUF805 family)